MGEVVVPLDYYCAVNNWFINDFCFNEGLAPLIKDGKFGYVDLQGKTAIPFEYDYTIIFAEGLAPIRKDHKWGFANKQGEMVIPMEYDSEYLFHDGLAPVARNGKVSLIDQKGKTALTFEDYNKSSDKFSEGLMAVTRAGKYGYIDKAGRIVIPLTLEYDYVGDFYEGFAVVRIGKFHEMEIVKNEKEEDIDKRWRALNKHVRWGMIDKTGDLVVPLKYTSIQGFNDGIAVLGNDGKQSFIDPTGKVFFVTDFDAMGWFSEGLAVVRKGGS